MAKYIYLPVVSAEMMRMANDMVQGHRKEGEALSILHNPFSQGAMKGVARSVGVRCLSRVREGDTVYIFCHGAAVPGSRRIGAARQVVHKGGNRWEEVEGTTKSYTQSELARLVEAEGLPKIYVDLHLLTCGSGLTGGDNPMLQRSLADRFHDELLVRGYARVQVTGYLGNISIGSSGKFSIQNGNRPLGESMYKAGSDPTARVSYRVVD